jgi:lipopolysaccharide transport system ATP-binding protein
MDTVIEVNNVWKKYCKDLGASLYYGLVDIGRGIFGVERGRKELRKYEFWSLKDVSFQVKRGEVIGVIGPNGSGKSTLLKLLNGLFMPDKGVVKVRGTTGALISVGAGFHQMLTGRENIYLNAAILGKAKKEIDEIFDEIVEFAEIREFLDTPVKNYSSGMYVRLGFSVAIHCLPDILLIDEVLSVGDESFQKKSLKKMYEIAKSGRTIIFVSHNLRAVRDLTKRSIYLKNGEIKFLGKTSEVIKKYLSDTG